MRSSGVPEERSPLLAEAHARYWGYAGDQASRRPRDGSRKRLRQATPHGGASRSGFRRHWRVSAGVAGVLMLSMALAGLGAIFSTVRRERAAPRTTGASLDGLDAAAAGGQASPTTAAGDSRQRVNVPPSGVKREEETDVKRKQGEDESSVSEVKEALGSGESGGSGGGGDTEEANDKSAPSKPNVFFIMVDDMGYNDIGYQSTDLQGVTPNLDKLAAGGIKMKSYYTLSICTPARASLMTGRYVVRYGLQYGVIEAGAPWGIPLTEKLFPQYMKDAGYETHMIGKWHLGSYTQSYIPSQRGFDTYMGYLNDEEMYWSHQSWTAHLNGRKFFDFGYGNSTGYYDIIERRVPDHGRNGSVSSVDDDNTMLSPTSSYSSSVSATANWTGTFKGEYSTKVFNDRALEILKGKTPFDDEPVYMYLAHQAVHDPLGLPPADSFTEEQMAVLDAIEANSDDDDAHLRKRFAKVLMYLDRTVGELVDYMEAEGWMDNSIIVLASDNGGCPSCGGSNYPLRGIKHSYWEGGTKVPAFMYSKSHIPEEMWGTEYTGMMHVTDWLPTIAGAAGFDPVGGAGPLDGINHWDYFVHGGLKAGGAYPREEMVYNFDSYILWTDENTPFTEESQLAQGAFRSGKYKLLSNVWCSGWYTFDKHALADDALTNSTLACNGNDCSNCAQGCTTANYSDYLFDVEADPREVNNLIDVYPDVAKDLRDRWVALAFEEFTDSAYTIIDSRAYYVWAKYNWWMVPWWDLMEGATEDPFGINGTSSSSPTTSSISSSVVGGST